MSDSAAVLREEAARIRARAAEQMAAANARAAALEEDARLAELGSEVVRSSKLQRIAERAAEIEAEQAAAEAAEHDAWLAQVYAQRVAMRARGEDIAVPESVHGMAALLEREEAEALARKAQN